jgi:threonyl-tRNA synthetase
MTCPFHITLYKTDLHSYRELPIRLYEHGTVYRYERSGVLHGTLRVRGFTQDDSHIFCRFDQLQQEIHSVLQLTRQVLHDFGFDEYEVKLSTRPEKYVGVPERWDEAEKILSCAMTAAGFKFEVDKGEGTFYGPKIDLKIKDSIGRRWQCSTIQVDFNLPDRFKATYRNDEGKDVPVVMVHRAILGSLERFFGILIEHHAGAFPPWLAPIQTAVLPISENHMDYATKVFNQLQAGGLRAQVKSENEKIGAKIRSATMEKIPYMLVVGEQEATSNTVSVRSRTGKDYGKMDVEKFVSKIKQEIDSKTQTE